MRYWIAALCAALLACLAPAPAAAAPGIPASCPRADGAYITCTPVVVVDPVTGLPIINNGTSPTAPSYVTDPNNASYTQGPIIATGLYYGCTANTAVPPVTTCTTYASPALVVAAGVAAGGLKQRAIFFDCSTAGTVDLIDPTGSSQEWHLGVGTQYQPYIYIGFANLTATCNAGPTTGGASGGRLAL